MDNFGIRFESWRRERVYKLADFDGSLQLQLRAGHCESIRMFEEDDCCHLQIITRPPVNPQPSFPISAEFINLRYYLAFSRFTNVQLVKEAFVRLRILYIWKRKKTFHVVYRSVNFCPIESQWFDSQGECETINFEYFSDTEFLRSFTIRRCYLRINRVGDS